MKSGVSKAMGVGMALTMGVAPVMMSVQEVYADSAILGNRYTMTWTPSDNGATKDYGVTLNGSQLVVKLQKMVFQSGEELKWSIQLLNGSGQVVSTQSSYDCALVNNERVATYSNLAPGNYTVRFDPSLHIYEGTVNVGVSFSSDGIVSDWKTHWAKEGIQEAMDKGWVVTTDEFRPNDQMTRAEVVKVLNGAYGFTKTGSIPFTDVPEGSWYYDYVRVALANGVISSDTAFRPNDKITRQEFATMISNIETGKVGDTNHDKYSKYKDFNQSGAWARNSIEYTVEKGYMGAGGEYFNPTHNITRAEAVTTLSRIK